WTRSAPLPRLQPNSGLPEFGHVLAGRSRIYPTSAGGIGRGACNKIGACMAPPPPPPPKRGGGRRRRAAPRSLHAHREEQRGGRGEGAERGGGRDGSGDGCGASRGGERRGDRGARLRARSRA